MGKTIPEGQVSQVSTAAVQRVVGRRVVCAAIRNECGDVISGARHFDGVMHRQILTSTANWNTVQQGFVDQHGVFLSREEAHEVATKAGQIIRRCGGDEKRLFSENLY